MKMTNPNITIYQGTSNYVKSGQKQSRCANTQSKNNRGVPIHKAKSISFINSLLL